MLKADVPYVVPDVPRVEADPSYKDRADRVEPVTVWDVFLRPDANRFGEDDDEDEIAVESVLKNGGEDIFPRPDTNRSNEDDYEDTVEPVTEWEDIFPRPETIRSNEEDDQDNNG